MVLTERRMAKLAGLSESTSPVVDETTHIEEGLRKTIRDEIEKVLAEVLAEREDGMLQYAQKNKSVGAAMGFAGVGFASSSRSTSTKAQSFRTTTSSSRTLGFKGPGF